MSTKFLSVCECCVTRNCEILTLRRGVIKSLAVIYAFIVIFAFESFVEIGAESLYFLYGDNQVPFIRVPRVNTTLLT
jgi:hypothetical protein